MNSVATIFVAIIASACAACPVKELPTCAANDVPVAVPVVAPPECSKHQAKGVAFSITNPLVWIPECNLDDTFQKEQFNAETKEAFCVDIHGIVYDGSLLKNQSVAPDCSNYTEPAAAPVKTCADADTVGTFKPACDGNSYQAKQCDGSGEKEYCWCVLPNGIPVPSTFVHSSTNITEQCNNHFTFNIDSECSGKEGVIAHPQYCDRYISCAQGRGFTCACSEGKAFDVTEKICTWRKDVVCPVRSNF